jgi:hypothetical protein
MYRNKKKRVAANSERGRSKKVISERPIVFRLPQAYYLAIQKDLVLENKLNNDVVCTCQQALQVNPWISG